MNFVLLSVLALFFLSIAFFIIKKLIIRAEPPTSRSDDHEEDLYIKVLDNMSDNQSIVQLFFNCKNLENKDIISVSDPQVEVYQRTRETEPWRKVGETEIVSNDLNPYFTKGVNLHYFKNRNTQLRFLVKDIDIHIKTDSVTYDLIGEYTCPLDKLLASPDGLTTDVISKKGKPAGQLTVICEPVHPTESSEGKKTIVHFNEVAVKGLPLGLPSFFQIFRLSSNTRILIYQSEVQQSSFNPKWKSFNIRERKLDEPLIISLWKWNNSSFGSCTFVGEATTTLENLLANNNTVVEIVGKQNSKIVAQLIIQYCKIEKKPINDFKTVTRTGYYTRYLNRFSYKDYFNQGLEIQTICAIDMTEGSNTYHQPQKGTPPLIEQILQNILSIVEPLDRDRSFTLFGYGAKPKDNSDVRPYFPLNGNPESPDCIGLKEAITCYQNNYSRFVPSTVSDAKEEKKDFYKKNDFFPVLKHVIDECEEGRQTGSLTRKYFIVFVLVTGDDINLKDTIRIIVEATEFPISIVLIAIGDTANFSNIGQLDADDHPLEVKNPNRKAKRDIVQLVHVDPARLKEQRLSRDYIEREIVAELPSQVCSFMSMNFITPKSI